MYEEVQGWLIYLKQTRAWPTRGNPDALCVAAIKQALLGCFKLSLRADGHAQGEFCFRLIRRERSDALKTEKRAMRIHHNHFVQLPCRGNSGFNNFGADDAVLIIREHNRVDCWQHAVDIVDDVSFARLAHFRRINAVDAHNVLLYYLGATGQDACLRRRRTLRVSYQALLVHLEITDRAAQLLARQVVAHTPGHENCRAHSLT